jgi:hypothetical protein
VVPYSQQCQVQAAVQAVQEVWSKVSSWGLTIRDDRPLAATLRALAYCSNTQDAWRMGECAAQPRPKDACINCAVFAPSQRMATQPGSNRLSHVQPPSHHLLLPVLHTGPCADRIVFKLVHMGVPYIGPPNLPPHLNHAVHLLLPPLCGSCPATSAAFSRATTRPADPSIGSRRLPRLPHAAAAAGGLPHPGVAARGAALRTGTCHSGHSHP